MFLCIPRGMRLHCAIPALRGFPVAGLPGASSSPKGASHRAFRIPLTNQNPLYMVFKCQINTNHSSLRNSVQALFDARKSTSKSAAKSVLYPSNSRPRTDRSTANPLFCPQLQWTSSALRLGLIGANERNEPVRKTKSVPCRASPRKRTSSLARSNPAPAAPGASDQLARSAVRVASARRTRRGQAGIVVDDDLTQFTAARVTHRRALVERDADVGQRLAGEITLERRRRGAPCAASIVGAVIA